MLHELVGADHSQETFAVNIAERGWLEQPLRQAQKLGAGAGLAAGFHLVVLVCSPRPPRLGRVQPQDNSPESRHLSSFPAFALCGLGISDIEFPVPSWGVPLATLQERLAQLSATPQPVSVPPGNSKAATLFRPAQRKVSLVSMARGSRSAGLLRGNRKWSLLDRQRRVQSSNIRKNLTFVGIAPMF